MDRHLSQSLDRWLTTPPDDGAPDEPESEQMSIQEAREIAIKVTMAEVGVVKTATYRDSYLSNSVFKLAKWLESPLEKAIAEALRPTAERLVAEKIGDSVTLADIEAKVKIQIAQ